MKAIKLLLAIGLLTAGSHAATINISAGTPAQGFLVTSGGIATTSHFLAVGNWNSVTSTFSQFGSTISDTAKVSGQIVATGPSSFNGTVIDLFVGLGDSIAAAGPSWVIIRTNSNLAFPADVSTTDARTFAATLPSTVTIIAKGNEANAFGLSGTTNTINFVPEPSVALLGALGIFGLVRRRR